MAASPFNQQAEATNIAARRSIASVLLCSFLPSACRRQAKGEQSQIAARNPRLPQAVARGEPEESAFPPLSRRHNLPFFRLLPISLFTNPEKCAIIPA